MIGRTLIAVAVSALLAQSAFAEKLYKWVDDHGVVHYGDSVPARYAKKERQVLNEQAVTIDRLDRELTAEERRERLRQAEEDRRQQEALARRRESDRVLLATYLSVEEIEMLRDRRVMTLESQIKVNEHYLRSLRDRLLTLEDEARAYNYPFDENSDRPPLPDDLAREIIETAEQLASRESDLERIRDEQTHIRLRFEEDIERFKALTRRSASTGGSSP